MKDEKDLRWRTKLFARRGIRLYCALRNNDGVAQVLGKLVLRSGTSVGANDREARRARSKNEFISKISDFLKEVDETLSRLQLMIEENVVPARRLQPLANEANELVAVILTIIKRARAAR
ncbi:MAG: four helix bundle protein [Limisphaerales bacterium]